MNRMTIGLDLDCTLSNLYTPWLAKFNSLYGFDVREEDIRGWDITKYVPARYRKNILDLLHDPAVALGAPVRSGAQEAVKKIEAMGHDVVVVSAFYPFTAGCAAKTEWLETHFPWLDLNKQLVFTGAKHLVGVDVLVDDCVANLEALRPSVVGVLFQTPANEDSSYGRQSLQYRALTWPEVVDIVASFT